MLEDAINQMNVLKEEVDQLIVVLGIFQDMERSYENLTKQEKWSVCVLSNGGAIRKDGDIIHLMDRCGFDVDVVSLRTFNLLNKSGWIEIHSKQGVAEIYSYKRPLYDKMKGTS